MDSKECPKGTGSQSSLNSVNHEFETEKDTTSSATKQNLKPNLVESETQIESPTPEKPESRRNGNVISSLARNLLSENFKDEKDKPTEIPDKFKVLADLLKEMEISIRLLGLRRKTPTLTNISAQVEVLAKRKFTCRDLAQIKYLLPDIIQIEKILIHDLKTLCMVPDLKITISKDSIKTLNLDQSLSLSLCQAFHSSLLNYLDSHPKDTEIPESILPEPFNPKEKTTSMKTLPKSPSSSSEEGIRKFSHLPSSFREAKSWKSNLGNQIQVPQDLLLPSQPEETKIIEVNKPCDSPLSVGKSSGVFTPNRELKSADVALTVTPAQQTPQRALPTPNNNKSESGNEKESSEVTVARSARKSLFYSESKDEEQILSLNEGLGCKSGDINGEGLSEKVTQVSEEIKGDSLPLTFDIIHQISRSKDCSLITKRELVHKIISNNLEIEDPSEVEEHLKILEEMVPDWICKKDAIGQTFYSVKHMHDPKAFRARLVETI